MLDLNIFFVLIFVVFVTDDPHFYRMFKMVHMTLFVRCIGVCYVYCTSD